MIPRFAPVASARHTLMVVAGVAVSAALLNAAVRSPGAMAPGRSRVAQYLALIVAEWLMVLLVRAGLRISWADLLGRAWRPGSRALRTLGLGVGVWLVVFVAAGHLVGTSHLRDPVAAGRTLAFMAPHGPLEAVMWVGLSLSAGFCEEVVFRGYLQRQLIALTRSPVAGVVLAGLLFGAGHLYQGWRLAATIAGYGVMLGLAAQWLRTLWPGILAHAAQDLVGGLLRP